MQWILVGLGNPGEEYTQTRHNVGRELVRALLRKEGIQEWKVDKKLRALVSRGEISGKKVSGILPETMMNSSGLSLKTLAVSKKQAEQLIVVHDDLDLPLGRIKLSFGSGAGGHRGVESVQKVLKTKDFVRIRVGISPTTPSGKLKKPDAEKVADFVLGAFRAPEQEKLKKVYKLASEAVELLLLESRQRAMTDINAHS